MTEHDYKSSGVDVAGADAGIVKIVNRVRQTWPLNGPFKVLLDIGYFANVVDVGNGIGVAVTTDGVGTKTIVCREMQRWDTIGIDLVAMNVNDLLCVGAKPFTMVDCIGINTVDADILDQIAIGLAEGAHRAGVSVIGGEISQTPELVHDLDLTATAVGIVPVDRVNSGLNVGVDDVIIGLESNGIHSNGLTLARKVLREAKFDLLKIDKDLGLALGDELLRPTHIYVPEIMAILDKYPVNALIHITGDGLLNMLRIDRDDTSYVIDFFPEPPPIFKLLQRVGRLDDKAMFEVFNMGIGFVLIVHRDIAEKVMSTLSVFGRRAWVIGRTIRDFERKLYLNTHGLVGYGKSFSEIVPQ
jgi:phosphoribosylformylglycinamidine cyclo-ligase